MDLNFFNGNVYQIVLKDILLIKIVIVKFVTQNALLAREYKIIVHNVFQIYKFFPIVNVLRTTYLMEVNACNNLLLINRFNNYFQLLI